MKIGIVEDEPMAAKRLMNLLTSIDSEIEVACILSSVEEAATYFQNAEYPDLLLMDIQLSDGISFELFDLLNITCPVAFTTAFDEYAINAFRVHAMDYLLKPIKKDDLRDVLTRLNQGKLEVSDNVKKLDHPAQTKKVLIKLGQSLKVLTLDSAAYYYSENKISFYMSAIGKRYPLDLSLDRLEEVLDVRRFFRIKRQFIVNQEHIKAMVSYSVSRIRLDMDPASKVELIVSKDKVSRFRKWLVS